MVDRGATLASDGSRVASTGASAAVLDEDTMGGQYALATTLKDIKQNVQVNERLLRDLVESLQMWVFDDKHPSTARSDQRQALTTDQITSQCAHMVETAGQLIDARMARMEESIKQEFTKQSIHISMAMKMNARETPNAEVSSSWGSPRVESPSQILDEQVVAGITTERTAEIQTEIVPRELSFQPAVPQDSVPSNPTDHHYTRANPLGMTVQRARLARHMEKLLKARQTQNLRVMMKNFGRKHISQKSLLGFMLATAYRASRSTARSVMDLGSEDLHFDVPDELAYCFARSTWLKRFVESAFFSIFSMTMIFSNALWIAMSDDYNMKEALRGNTSELPVFVTVDRVFAIMFTVEIALRIAAQRCNFFFAWDWRYNMFDLIVVLTGLADSFMSVGLNSTTLRVVRILRVLRMFKMFRSISAFTELQQLLCAVTNCARTLICSLFIFFLVSFMCAITCMELLLSSAEDDALTMAAKKKWFSSFLKSMETVIMIATFGVDWREVVQPERSALLGVIMFFVLFMAFVFMPIIVGTHAMRVTNFQKYEPYVCIQRKFQDADTFIEGLRLRCRARGYKMQDRVSVEVLADIAEDPEIEKFLLAHELEFQVADVFHFFDLDDLGMITIKQFVYGCHFLTVAASVTDSFFLGEQLSKVEELMSVTMDRMKTLERMVNRPVRHVKPFENV